MFEISHVATLGEGLRIAETCSSRQAQFINFNQQKWHFETTWKGRPTPWEGYIPVLHLRLPTYKEST